MNLKLFLTELDRITVYTRGGHRAPHKPLLLLWTLAHIKDDRLHTYATIKKPMEDLLKRFNSSSYIDPRRPFWRMEDRIWEIQGKNQVLVVGKNDPNEKSLMDKPGGFTEEIYEMLLNDPQAIARAIQRLLNNNFPPSLHEEIRDAIGLPDEIVLEDGKYSNRSARDPEFRKQVLYAYEERCAVCDYDLRINDYSFGLEAAHIKWFCFMGPNEVSNGLALCSFHHKALDYGVMCLERKAERGSQDFVIVLSDKLDSTHRASESYQQFISIDGQILRPPRDSEFRPHIQFVEWHQKHVFKGKPK